MLRIPYLTTQVVHFRS